MVAVRTKIHTCVAYILALTYLCFADVSDIYTKNVPSNPLQYDKSGTAKSASASYLTPELTASGASLVGTGVAPATIRDHSHDDHHHHHHHHHHGEDGHYDPNDDGTGWDIRTSVPGEPSQDYPIYHSVPRTNFHCTGKAGGYYADIESGCQAFHVCTEGSDKAFSSFLCPNGSIFNQAVSACDWWNHVNCQTSERYYPLNTDRNLVTSGPALMLQVKKMQLAPMMKPPYYKPYNQFTNNFIDNQPSGTVFSPKSASAYLPPNQNYVQPSNPSSTTGYQVISQNVQPQPKYEAPVHVTTTPLTPPSQRYLPPNPTQQFPLQPNIPREITPPKISPKPIYLPPQSNPTTSIPTYSTSVVTTPRPTYSTTQKLNPTVKSPNLYSPPILGEGPPKIDYRYDNQNIQTSQTTPKYQYPTTPTSHSQSSQQNLPTSGYHYSSIQTISQTSSLPSTQDTFQYQYQNPIIPAQPNTQYLQPLKQTSQITNTEYNNQKSQENVQPTVSYQKTSVSPNLSQPSTLYTPSKPTHAVTVTTEQKLQPAPQYRLPSSSTNQGYNYPSPTQPVHTTSSGYNYPSLTTHAQPQPHQPSQPVPTSTTGYHYPQPVPTLQPKPQPIPQQPSQPAPTLNSGYHYPQPAPTPQPQPIPQQPSQPAPTSNSGYHYPQPVPTPQPIPQKPSQPPPTSNTGYHYPQPVPTLQPKPQPIPPQPSQPAPTSNSGYHYPQPVPTPQPQPIPQKPSPTSNTGYPYPQPVPTLQPQPQPIPQQPSQPSPIPNSGYHYPQPVPTPQPQPIPQKPSQPTPTSNTGYHYPQPIPTLQPQPQPIPQKPSQPAPTPTAEYHYSQPQTPLTTLEPKPQVPHLPQPTVNTGYDYSKPTSEQYQTPIVPINSSPQYPSPTPTPTPSQNYLPPVLPTNPSTQYPKPTSVSTIQTTTQHHYQQPISPTIPDTLYPIPKPISTHTPQISVPNTGYHYPQPQYPQLVPDSYAKHQGVYLPPSVTTQQTSSTQPQPFQYAKTVSTSNSGSLPQPGTSQLIPTQGRLANNQAGSQTIVQILPARSFNFDTEDSRQEYVNAVLSGLLNEYNENNISPQFSVNNLDTSDNFDLGRISNNNLGVVNGGSTYNGLQVPKTAYDSVGYHTLDNGSDYYRSYNQGHSSYLAPQSSVGRLARSRSIAAARNRLQITNGKSRQS